MPTTVPVVPASVVPLTSSSITVHSIWVLFQNRYLCDLHDAATDIPIDEIIAAVRPPSHVLFQDNPVSPFNNVARRRYRGFGKRSITRSTTHDSPSPFWLMHKAWDYLEPDDRAALCKTHSNMAKYAALRVEAFTHRDRIREALKRPRRPPEEEPQLDPTRAKYMGAALLSFDFDYGDLVRWLGGEYTNQHRDWDALQRQMDIAMEHPQRPGYPGLQPEIAMKSFREGVPLKGHYSCTRSDFERRVAYDNHKPLDAHLEATREKFGQEEAKSFHIAFPRFIAFFMLGAMINPISWVVQKGKGRLIIDASTKLHSSDTGAPNSYIPKPGTPGHAHENPPVYYGSALRRHLSHIYNLRIQYPKEDILQHTDDIDAAFRRILYHPELAIAFGYVFMEFFIVPVGEIFGARNSPSFWCVPAEMRAHMGAVLDHSATVVPLAEAVAFEPEPTPDLLDTLVPAVRDDLNQGIAPQYENRHHLAMFVDDNIIAAIREHMREALTAAVASAYQCFGDPALDRRGACLAPAKFDMTASHRVTFVGYIIDSRTMRVVWPDEKVQQLRSLLEEWLARRSSRSPSQIAKLLGFIRHGAFLCQLGNFTSIRLQWTLNSAIITAGQKSSLRKKWWAHQRIKIPSEVFADLRLMLRSLSRPHAHESHAWSRPIAMLIPRSPTCIAYSDAAHTGLGGWCKEFSFVWRLTRNDMVIAGFPMKDLDENFQELNRWTPKEQLPEGHEDLLHINPLEFLAIIINVWLCLFFIRRRPPNEGGHHVLVRADNTSAISWMKYAARSHKPPIRNLAYLLQSLLLESQTAETVNLEGKHWPGKDNEIADAASRPELYPSLDSAIRAFSPLRTCQPFRIPLGLLSTLARWISYNEIGATYVGEVTKLLELEPKPFDDGATAIHCGSGIFTRSRQKGSL